MNDSSSINTKNIVIFSARYLPNVGGVEYFTANLGGRLASIGYNVTIVTTEPTVDDTQDAQHQQGDGTLRVVRLDSWGPKRMPFAKRNKHNREILALIEELGSFHALINTRFYDLSYIAARLCSHVGVCPVLIDHGTGYIKFKSKSLSLASKLAEHAITERLKRFPINYYGVSKDASHWLENFGITSHGEIHNALDTEAFLSNRSGRDFRREFDVSDGAICVAYAARLLADKGADVVLEAARALSEDERLRFFIAGSGPLEEEIRTASNELPNLDYVGMLDHGDLASLLCACDVFCLPTRYSEGLPTSLLEAAACSCALIASRAGGVNEIIPSEDHGIILGHTQPSDLTYALKRLADDPDHLIDLQHAARRHVEDHFTWENTITELLEAFSVASRKP